MTRSRARQKPPRQRTLGRSQILQGLIDETPEGAYLSIDIQSGHCYAIAVIDDQGDEVAVLEGDDLDDRLVKAGERICKDLPNGAYAWPGKVDVSGS